MGLGALGIEEKMRRIFLLPKSLRLNLGITYKSRGVELKANK